MQIINIIISYLGILLWAFGLYLAFFSHLRGILGRAAVVMWKKKYLWLLGFFAGMTAYGGEVNFFFQRFNTVATIEGWLQGIRSALLNGSASKFFTAAKNLWAHNTGQLSGYLGVALAIIAVLAWLVIVSQGALVRIVGRMQQEKNTGLTDGLSVGTEKFWSLVELNLMGLLTGIASWVILTALPAAIYLLTSNGGWSVVAYFGALASIIISASVIFLIQFSTAGIVLYDTRLIPAIIDGWRLFKNNILASIETAIAVFTVNVVVLSLVTAELFLFMNASIFTVQGFLIVSGVIIFTYALLSTFSFSVWTIFYTKLMAGKSPSKLNQWTTQLANFAGQRRVVS